MSNTRPVISSLSPIGEVRGNKVFAISPFTQFLQQFVQKAPTIIDVSSLSPYQANQLGTIIVSAASTGTTLTRGNISIVLGSGQKIIPINITDIVSWTGPAVVKFLGA